MMASSVKGQITRSLFSPLSLYTCIIPVLLMQIQTCKCAEELDTLYTTLLTNYSKKTIPESLINETTMVQIDSEIKSLNGFEELSGELSITMIFHMKWMDRRLSWNLTDNGGIEYLLVEEEEIWIPQIFIIQPFEKMDKIGGGALTRIKYDGEVDWTTVAYFRLSCSVNVRRFPFDVQICHVSISGWNYARTEVFLHATKPVLSRSYFTGNGRWELLDSPVRNCAIGDITDGPTLVDIQLTLKRLSEFYIVYLFIPIAFLGLMNVFVFLMPPQAGERASVAITMFLSFAVLMDSLTSIVPASSSPVALVYFYFLFLMVYSSTILFLCIISLRIYDKDRTVSGTVKVIVFILSFAWLKLLLVKFVSSSSDTETTEDHHSEMKTYGTKNVTTFQGVTWVKAGKLFDKYCFVLLLSIYLFVSYSEFDILTSADAPTNSTNLQPFIICE